MDRSICFLISAAIHVAVISVPVFKASMTEEEGRQAISVVFLGGNKTGQGGGDVRSAAQKPAPVTRNVGQLSERRAGVDATSFGGPDGDAGSIESAPDNGTAGALEGTNSEVAELSPAVSSVSFSVSDPSQALGVGDGVGSSAGGVGEDLGVAGGANGQGSRGVGEGNGGYGRFGPASVSVKANYAYSPKPDYPERARREGWEGAVLLRVLVDQDGKARFVEVNDSSGFEALDRAALETVKGWLFHPARYGEKPIESWVKIPIVFRLADLKE